MNDAGIEKLFGELLESQIETGKYEQLNLKRIREALTVGPALSDEEQRLLLLSPVAREDFWLIKEEITNDLLGRLEEQGIALELLPLAAADKSDKVVMHSTGFSVTLINKNEIGVPWVILVQISSAYRKIISPMTTLKLVDSGGLEWLRQKPDSNGEMTALWTDSETDLVDRASRFSLILEPA